jgi:Cys-tRNA(Pro) deacylase
MSETPAFADPRLTVIEHQVVRHGRVGSLEEAAELRGVPASAVIKTMVVRRGDGDYVFVLVPGDRVIDWSKLRTHLGVRRLSMPDADEALNVTGYVRGTITPFGSSHPWPVIADTLVSSGTVSIGGGAPSVSFTLDGADLCRTLDADISDVTGKQAKQ